MPALDSAAGTGFQAPIPENDMVCKEEEEGEADEGDTLVTPCSLQG